MQTSLTKEFLETSVGQEAEKILRACVHCGFCTATCPTYQLTGDELDGPRGRIYLIKQMLEGQSVSSRTQFHLDRCLTCRACETTCPSGVRYGRLVDIGRELIETRTERSPWMRLQRWGLRQVLPYPQRFAVFLGLGRLFSPVLPAELKAKIPPRQANSNRPVKSHSRRMLIMEGCAQSVTTPETNNAAARVLDRLGISLISVQGQGCCGAVSQHLAAAQEAKSFIKRNINAWWPEIEAGAEAIVVSASGCAVHVKEYGELLSDDPDYAEKAAKVASLAKDLSEVVAAENLDEVKAAQGKRIAFHSPCSLQHGQQLPGRVEAILQRVGFELVEVDDAHLCCGSAGTYSILQPEMSVRLRDNKLEHLQSNEPELIATANVGCQLHLDSKSQVPVKHWIELLDFHS
jgi:glycolate oxidase iron-sulfur subunit